MKFFVDISKSQRKCEKQKICGNDITAIYQTGIEPGKSLCSGGNITSLRGKEKGLSVITMSNGDIYVSPLTVEEVYQRIIKAEADATYIFGRRTEYNMLKDKEKQKRK